MSNSHITPRFDSVQCISPAGLHRMAYREWGDPDNPKVLVCVHGVTRVSSDFDSLARALCDEYRVVCPDVAGRGRSDWLANPDLYRIPQYISDMVSLIACVTARTGADGVHWFGTSMGGLIGLGLASLPNTPIRKLVLNDIGPTLDRGALQRIGDYIGQEVKFDSFEQAAAFIREVSLTFGPHSDEEWHKLAADVLRQDQDGKWIRHYDLRLAEPFKSATLDSMDADEALMWQLYRSISCPTLVVRGEESDLLSRETAVAMSREGPKATLVELPGVGHAPTFMHEDQIGIARDFLLK